MRQGSQLVVDAKGLPYPSLRHLRWYVAVLVQYGSIAAALESAQEALVASGRGGWTDERAYQVTRKIVDAGTKHERVVSQLRVVSERGQARLGGGRSANGVEKTLVWKLSDLKTLESLVAKGGVVNFDLKAAIKVVATRTGISRLSQDRLAYWIEVDRWVAASSQ